MSRTGLKKPASSRLISKDPDMVFSKFSCVMQRYINLWQETTANQNNLIDAEQKFETA